MNSGNTLIEGKYKFSDIVNIKRLTDIFSKFSKATGFTIGLVDNNSLEVLVKTGWHDICVNFHRANKKACEVCKRSNRILFTDLKQEKSVRIVECEHGLYDCATPIIIEGKHVANLVTGQLLMQKPDIKQFEKQAKHFSFNKQKYLEALNKVPIVSKKDVAEMMDYLAELSAYIAEKGLDKLRTNKLNEELLKAKEKAEESDRLKSAFLANMSHEVRTPLNAILGFSNLLRKQNLSKEKKEEIIKHINDGCNRLLIIISDIIDVSKIDSNQLSITYNECNLNSLINSLQNQFSVSNINKKINIRAKTSLDDKDSNICTDETRLNQILSNLIENALKFTKEGAIEFGYDIKANIIQFYVKDTGIGIKPEHHKLIFERFRQVDDNYSGSGTGTGLGLSIVKGLLDLFKGEIWVESEINKGTTFYFTIPYSPAEQEANNKIFENDFEFEKGDGVTILIVEDELLNFFYLKVLLENYNYNIIHAKNGQEAVEIVNSNSSIDLVLMDTRMPTMNGLEATEKIRETNKSIPIIAQTAYVMAEDKMKAKKAGCNDYLSKPISVEMLADIIKKHIKKGATSRSKPSNALRDSTDVLA